VSLRRLLPLALVVAGLAVAAPAVAADPPTYCPDPGVYHLADGSTVFGNDSIAGCVLVRSSLSGALRLEQVIPAPGWTYVVKSDGGDHNRVQVQLTESTTRERVEFRIEPGKTVIK
jgi:hypothetical protein